MKKLLVLLSLLLSFTSAALGQEQSVTVKEKLLSTDRSEPVKIVGYKVGTPDNWFKGLEIEIENVNQQPVNSFVYALTVMNDDNSKGIAACYLKYNTDSSQPALAPNAKVKMAISESTANGLKTLVTNAHLSAPMQPISFVLQYASYADGSTWSGGKNRPKDPNTTPSTIKNTQSLKQNSVTDTTTNTLLVANTQPLKLAFSKAVLVDASYSTSPVQLGCPCHGACGDYEVTGNCSFNSSQCGMQTTISYKKNSGTGVTKPTLFPMTCDLGGGFEGSVSLCVIFSCEQP